MTSSSRPFATGWRAAARRWNVRRSLLALTVSIALVAFFATGASASPSGGWNHLGTGGSPGTPSLNGAVAALNADAGGLLLVGGAFTNAGGKPAADRIAMWNGNGWDPLGPISNGSVHAIAVNGGTVYAGGTFVNAGGNDDADFLAEWNGASWAPFCDSSGPAFDGNVEALEIIGSTLYVAGSFHDGADISSADGLLACDLATGAPSSPFEADGDGTGTINALAVDGDGTLYAGGTFQNLTGDPFADWIASFDEAGWHPLGTTRLTGIVRGLAASGNDVYVSTDTVNIVGIPQADHIARWDGSDYHRMGASTSGSDGWFPSTTFINAMTTSGPLVFATGSFQNANGDPLADFVAYYDGITWHHLGSNGAGNGPWSSGDGLAATVFDKEVVVGGGFTSAGGDVDAAFAASYPIRRPDARIGTSAAGPFAGNNVYNVTGAGQSKTISVARGHSGTLFLSIQSDALVEDDLTVVGTGAATGFTVTYIRGAQNVTAQVKNGTYSIPNIGPGVAVTLKMVVRLSQSSANTCSFLIKTKSGPGTTPDVVKATVKAT